MGTGKRLAESKARQEVSKSDHKHLGAVRLAAKAPHPPPCETDALSSDRASPIAAHE